LAKGFQDARYRRLVEQLVEKRKDLGLSQQALADRLGTHQQFVSRYETGERRLDAVELVDVASALDLDASTLIAQVRPLR
jgi:transcriptional regulator with XRE-family HTH domain